MALVSIFSIFLFQFCITFTYRCNAQNLSKVPAVFIFGDSGVDTGTNNYLPTIFRANYAPYGMNFPGRIPTGRFSDGKLVPDMFASMLGLKEAVPPYLQPNLSDHELRTGVCFASAAAGLDDQTNAYSGATIMSKQPKYLADYIERLTKIVGEQEARRIVREALVIINAGNVDFIYNYYFIRTNRILEYSITEYQDFLLNNLRTLIKKLYDMGCRKMSISGIAPLGCVPLIITANSPLRRTCLEKVNSDAQIYNEKLVNLLPQVEAELPGSKLLYADLYTPLIEMIENPQKHGFVETARGCCGTGLIEFGQLCNAAIPVCENPHQYVFWDVVHPGETAYRYIFEYLAKQIGSQI